MAAKRRKQIFKKDTKHIESHKTANRQNLTHCGSIFRSFTGFSDIIMCDHREQKSEVKQQLFYIHSFEIN